MQSNPYMSTTIQGTQTPHNSPSQSHVPMIAKQISNMKIDQHTLYIILTVHLYLDNKYKIFFFDTKLS